MKLMRKFSLGVFLACMLFIGQNAIAGEALDANAVRALFMGKTMHGKHLIRGFEFSTYFDKDGKTAIRNQNGKSTQTTYSFKGNQHCLFWKGQDRCATIEKNSDGTYDRVSKAGKHIIEITKIVAGKDF